MKRVTGFFVLTLFFLSLACWVFAVEKGMKAKAELYTPEGERAGSVMFEEADKGLKISIKITGLAPGKHAFHIHEAGVCMPPDFKSAGGHFNPENTKHGFLNPQGPHAGDLPNIEVDENGVFEGEVITKRLTLLPGEVNFLLKEGGTSVVIHQSPDDYITDPAGRGGARIACGVIEKIE
ncbi:MAG: superoxide dismutase family protein [Candidatus Omnitrophica bacterium]|nr:superoxide dismutase family protein [Candidatus Omnitrophota bacterium]MBD3268822.1 superoxide dismutase family protein [Candidatus Omnitrophota bacterium]